MQTPKIILFIISSFLCSNFSFGQQAVHAGGTHATSSGGEISFSVGELTIKQTSESEGNITSGVQLPYEIHLFQNIDESGYEAKLTYKAYPNPVNDVLQLELIDQKDRLLSYTIVSLNGTTVGQGEILDDYTDIQMAEHASGIYFINIIENKSNYLTTFKVIKK